MSGSDRFISVGQDGATEGGPNRVSSRAPQDAALYGILSTCVDLVYVLERSGKYLYANPAGSRVLGLEPIDVVGKTWRELGLPPDVMEPFEVLCGKVFAGGESVTGEAHLPTAFGVKDFEYSLSPILDGDRLVGSIVAIWRDVTERKRTEVKLRQAASELQAIFRALPDLYFRLDSEGTILDYKAGLTTDLYAPPQVFLGSRIQDLFPPNAAQQLMEAVRRVLKQNSLVTTEYSLPLPIGEQIFEARLLPLLDSQVIVIVRNITERKEIEKALRKSEERYRTLAEAAHDSIFIVNRSGYVQYVNSYAAKQFGLEPTGIIGKPRDELFPPDVAEVERRCVGEVFETGRPVYLESRTPVLDREIWLGTWLAPIMSESGEVTSVLGISRDITKRRRAEEALRESEARFRAIFERAGIGIVLVDTDGRAVECNPALQRMLGYDEEGLRGRLLSDITHPDDATADMDLYRELVAGKRDHYQMEKRYIRRDGAVILGRLIVSLIRGAKGEARFAISMVEDITDRKRAEQFREEYIHTISHDLRVPLTVIQWHAQVLGRALERSELEGQVRRSAEMIITGAARMNTMIQDLVDSARLEAGQLRLEKRPVDLRAFVSAFVSGLVRQASAVVDLGQAKVEISMMDAERIKVDIPVGLPAVNADPNRLERILMNLLTNALKYSPPQTEVLVKGTRTDEGVVLSVSDEGVGVAPEDRPHIFDRFYRAKAGRKAEGLGLGLHITKLLVEAHGGHIWVESEPGKGSTFCFTLPRA